MGLSSKLKELFCKHKFEKIAFLGNTTEYNAYNTVCVGRYQARCTLCNKSLVINSTPLFPLTPPPGLVENSPYDKESDKLMKDIEKTHDEIVQLIKTRAPDDWDSGLESEIMMKWRYIITCRMWIDERDKTRWL